MAADDEALGFRRHSSVKPGICDRKKHVKMVNPASYKVEYPDIGAEFPDFSCPAPELSTKYLSMIGIIILSETKWIGDQNPKRMP
ncbi:hypothetical protein [Sphingomonas sp.]|uniref:hypothetical protein n=1 Tax=Sphingomonas sp. TaxID=28214 RepID=UPI0025D6E5CE|nr:hypothetical protein [Sphingomonas sp.]